MQTNFVMNNRDKSIMIDSELVPIIPPRYYDGYLVSKDRKYDAITGDYIDTGTWTVYTYPHIVIWEFASEEEATLCANKLNELDKIFEDGYVESYE